MSLIAELQRRKVFKVGAAYLVVAWLAVQGASIGFPAFDAPPWALRIFILVALLGFPVAVVMAWVFDVTPEGVKFDSTTSGSKRLFGAAALLIVLALGWYFYGQPAFRRGESPTTIATYARSSRDRTIAVLPFLNLSADASQEYFSEGVTEEILNVLAGIEGFTVTSRTSSFHYKGTSKSLPQIARELGVNYILEGSVRTAGKQVRITAQLIRVAGDEHLWSESYTRDLTDIFAVQEEIARNVSTALKDKLSDRDEARLTKTGTHDVAAYQAYLRGRQFTNQRTLKSLQDAVASFKEALAADSRYVDAWAGLAQAYALIPEYSTLVGKTIVDTVPQALDAANHALKLDPTSSGALTARAYVRRTSLFDWEGAESDFRAAIASDPRNSVAHMWYSELLLNQRRYPEAISQADIAVALEPLAPIMQSLRGTLEYCLGYFAAAVSYEDEALRLQPDFSLGLRFKTLSLTQLRRFDDARAVANQYPLDQREMMLAFVAATRDTSAIDVAVARIKAQDNGNSLRHAQLFALLGRHDLALASLERMFQQHSPYRANVYQYREFDPLLPNPRFQALLKQVGLPHPAKGGGAQHP